MRNQDAAEHLPTASQPVEQQRPRPESDAIPALPAAHAAPAADADPRILAAAGIRALESIADSLARIADHVAPEPDSIVGTPYVAGRLGCTTVWVAEMVRKGDIPASYIVAGTGNGKPWKFHRDKIDAWLANR